MRAKVLFAVVTPKLHVKQAAGITDGAMMPCCAGT